MSTTSSQGYADLSNDSYKDRRAGVRRPFEQEPVYAAGVEYKVLEHADNPRTGYQGTIYQRADNGEIVVAHRGTEFDKWTTDKGEFTRDVAWADGGMVLARANQQVPDAIELTRSAMAFAAREGQQTGHPVPPTVTGHSLGGLLAQVSAHHFGLRGETFNAYGARSLNLRVGDGHGQMTNHVVAGDPVSAASPHFGDVEVYAKPEEIVTLEHLHAGRSPAQSAAAAASLVGDSHRLYNFLSEDDGKPHVSMLSDPAARTLAHDNAKTISAYRSDVGELRTAMTASGHTLSNFKHVLDTLRGPLEPGEPAHLQAQGEAHGWASQHATIRATRDRHEVLSQDNWRTPLALPEGPSRPADATLHCQLLDGVSKLGFQGAQDLSNDGPGGRVAADLLHQCRHDGLTRVDHVVMGTGESPRVFAVQGEPRDPAHLRANVELQSALQTPTADSFAQVERLGRLQEEQQTLAASQRQQMPQPEQSGPSLSR
jgi:hypothetical protein